MAKLTYVAYAALVQVTSTNLNELQLEAINMPVRVAASRARQTAGTAGSFDNTGTFTSAAANNILTMAMDLKPGTRISAARARVRDASSQQVTLQLIKMTDGVAGSVIAQAASAQDGTDQTLVISGQTEDVPEVGVSVGEVWVLRVTFTTSTLKVYTFEWDTERIP